MDLMASLLFTFGRRREARACWTEAAEASRTSGDQKNEAKFLFKLARSMMEDGDLDPAKKLLGEARRLVADRPEELANCLVALSEVAERDGRSADKKILLQEAIRARRDALAKVADPPRRAGILCEIGSLHIELEEDLEALALFDRAKRIYDELSLPHGSAKALSALAGLTKKLGDSKRARGLFQDLKTRVDGSAMFDLVVVANLNLAEYAKIDGDLDLARRLLVQAETLCRKYHLPHIQDVTMSIDHLETVVSADQIPSVDMAELIDDLYLELRECPTAKHEALRYWLFCRGNEINRNLRGSLGIHAMVITKELAAFWTVARQLSGLFDWKLLVDPTEYLEPSRDTIPVSGGMHVYGKGTVLLAREKNEDSPESESMSEASHNASLLSRLAQEGIPAVLPDPRLALGGTLPRYFVVGGSNMHRQHQQEQTLAILGWSFPWSPLVHQMVLDGNAQTLKAEQSFFIYFNRGATEDVALWDLRVGRELRMVPIYSDAPPTSDRIRHISSTSVQLPLIKDHHSRRFEKQAERSRELLANLLSCTPDTAKKALAAFAAEMRSFTGEADTIQLLDLRVAVLGWKEDDKEHVHPVFVVAI